MKIHGNPVHICSRAPRNKMFLQKEGIPCSFCGEMIEGEMVGGEKQMNPREQVLEAAKKAVLSDRNKEYGSPKDNFQNIADLRVTRLLIRLRTLKWYLHSADGQQVIEAEVRANLITAADIAVAETDVKTARIEESPKKMDHWVDIAGYAACGYDCVADKDQSK